MKAAIYVEHGLTQIALTGETEWEKTVLKMMADANNLKAFWGGFYHCQGGWARHQNPDYKESLMFLLEKRPEMPL